MKPEDINKTIAEWCGWEYRNPAPEGETWPGWACWKRPDGAYMRNKPNYYHDLNAVHEAEALLFKTGHTDTLNINYWNQLWKICKDEHCKLTTIAHATAPKRCEALLRTLGLWREE